MSAKSSSAPDPISPELALVDPELAEQARRDLPQEADQPRRVVRAASPTPRPHAPDGGAPRALYVPRPEPTLPPGPPPSAPRGAAARPQRARWLRRPRIVVALLVVYALVGWVAFRIARHDHGSPAAEKTPGAEAEAPRPTQLAPKIPSTIARTQHPRTFVWLAVRGASFYEIRIFRRDVEIFEARTTEPRLTLPRTWRYGGTSHRLKPGLYRWLVLPGFGTRDRPRYGAAVVSARLRVGR